MDKQLKIGNINLPKFPILLAPMEDITDISFRLMCKKHGADILISEFAASDALIRNVEKTKNKLRFEECERPFGIQIFGNDEAVMVEAAKIIESYQPDFIDINWGCPVKKVALKGAGSGMLQNPDLLVKITAAIIKAVHIPVTVKTRLGWDDNHKIIVDLSQKLQDIGIAALTIHGRTRSQMYHGLADWNLIGQVAQNTNIHIPIFGNGDICSDKECLQAKNNYPINGIMIGRAAIGNPWIFEQCKSLINNNVQMQLPSNAERLEECRQHFHLALKYKNEKQAVLEMRKHYKNYFKDIKNFKETRIRLLTCDNVGEIENIFSEIENKVC